jgi:hypothetical protein
MLAWDLLTSVMAYARAERIIMRDSVACESKVSYMYSTCSTIFDGLFEKDLKINTPNV